MKHLFTLIGVVLFTTLTAQCDNVMLNNGIGLTHGMKIDSADKASISFLRFKDAYSFSFGCVFPDSQLVNVSKTDSITFVFVGGATHTIALQEASVGVYYSKEKHSYITVKYKMDELEYAAFMAFLVDRVEFHYSGAVVVTKPNSIQQKTIQDAARCLSAN